jgi:Zn-dependent peptidase ImmA (M78 family)
MVKPDDSCLDPNAQRAVEERARTILDRAGAWDRFPTPVEDIVKSAKLRVAPTGAFDARTIIAYVQNRTNEAARAIKSALSKVFGLYDSDEALIHIDDSVNEAKQNFLKLHETGHHEIPTHRKLFRLFQDCDKTLAPEIADRFEREANSFARFVLFQGDTYQREAADCPLEIKTPLRLAKRFGASAYASVREFVRTHHEACIVYVLEPVELVPGSPVRAQVRRIETSPSFRKQFGVPTDAVIDASHALGRLLPIGRRMTRPTMFVAIDRNDLRHECVGEAFSTPRNVFLLVCPLRGLTYTTVILPSATLRFESP